MDQKGAYATVTHPVHMAAAGRIQGRVRQIVLAFAVMTLPMLVFSVLLLGLVFRYRVAENEFATSALRFKDADYSTAYLVRISATTLITVASWSSTISPILIGFAVSLASYPLARRLLVASERRDLTSLPTPFQLTLIVGIISSSSFSALWSWLTYTFGWRGRREGQVRVLKNLTTTLILGILLSTLVLVTDTWLHFTTKTISFSQVSTNTDASGLGFGVYDNCTNVGPTQIECNINNPAFGFILWRSDPLRVLSNISDEMAVQLHAADQEQFVYVAPPQTSRLESLDYTVTTFAMTSQCSLVTTQCIDASSVSGASTPYKCPFAFQGRVDTSVGADNAAVAMAYFTDSSGSDNNTLNTELTSPYYYSAMLLTNLRMGRPLTLQEDPDIVIGGHGGATIAGVFCSSNVYDVTYSSINGTITSWEYSLANSSTTRIVQGTQRLTFVGQSNLIQAVSVAGLSDTAQGIADQFALAYSQTALAAASGAFEPRVALASQKREQILVARVPKAPLFVLIAANLLLVLFGIILTFQALVAVRGDTGEVQARLSIPALVATIFESRVRGPAKAVEEFFEERHGEQGLRLGFTKTVEGGWVFEGHSR